MDKFSVTVKWRRSSSHSWFIETEENLDSLDLVKEFVNRKIDSFAWQIAVEIRKEPKS